MSKGDDPKPGAEQGYMEQLCSSVPPNHSYFENWGELQMLRPVKGAALHNLFLLCRSMGTNGCEKNWVEDLGSLERAQRKNREVPTWRLLKRSECGMKVFLLMVFSARSAVSETLLFMSYEEVRC